MALALAVDQAFAQRHEAAALPIDEGAPVCCRAHAFDECAIGGQRTGVQLGIAARQIDRVGIEIGRLIRQGEKKSSAPAVRQPSSTAG